MMDINDMRSRLQADPPYPRLMEQAFALLAEVERLRGEILKFADHAEDSGWYETAKELLRRAEGETK
jgi:hypothetical protein